MSLVRILNAKAKVTSSLLKVVVGTLIGWILELGFWNDGGRWKDVSAWND